MTLDLEKMARDSSLRAAVSIRRHIYWNMDDEKQNTVAKLIEFEVLEFARSVQKASEEHWVAVVDAEHKEWAAQLEGEPVNVWEALDNVRQGGVRTLAEEEG